MRASDWPVDCVLIGLRLERSSLFARIDARIDAWMACNPGFIDEVRDLLARGYEPSLPSMSGIGYREVASYLAGTVSLEEAVVQFKNATHQYARRQMTWFGARPSVQWLDAETVRVDDVLRLLPATR
jgi:tRNA dimethylallyltransferase